jgi:hypothetical protein
MDADYAALMMVPATSLSNHETGSREPAPDVTSA